MTNYGRQDFTGSIDETSGIQELSDSDASSISLGSSDSSDSTVWTPEQTTPKSTIYPTPPHNSPTELPTNGIAGLDINDNISVLSDETIPGLSWQELNPNTDRTPSNTIGLWTDRFVQELANSTNPLETWNQLLQTNVPNIFDDQTTWNEFVNESNWQESQGE